MKRYRISVIGAGNGGHAIAGHFGLLGHTITIYDLNCDKLEHIKKAGGILLTEAISGFGPVHKVACSLQEAVEKAEIIMVVTTADAHRELAEKMVPLLEDGQLIVLNPGRTCGAIEFKNALNKLKFDKKIKVAEAQSLIYACRVENPATVRVIGVKDKVLLSALPGRDTAYVEKILNSVYNCFYKVDNVLITSLENIGAIFHPSVVLFNAATIERGQNFYFYNDMTPRIADFLEKIDHERIMIGKAFGIELTSATEWISKAYPDIEGDDLCTKMKNNPAYYKILAPNTLHSRLLLEDIPTGILPMMELGKLCGVDTPLMNSVFEMASTLVGKDFTIDGRSLKNIGLEGKTKEEILNLLK
jgi:opine dehydrogenase